MSIKIGQAAKNVVDVIVGTSSSSSAKKNIDIVKDWNGKIIWERDSRIKLDDGNTSFSYENSWSSTSSAGSYEPTPKPYMSYEGDGRIQYTGGASPVTLYEGRDYTVSWSNNRVESTSGTKTGTGTMHINGAGSYMGTIDRTFSISYTYKKDTPRHTVSATANPSGSGTFSGTGTFDEGSSISVTAKPSTYYHFTYWGSNTSDTANPKTFTLGTSNVSLTGNFALDTHAVSTYVNPMAAFESISGAGSYTHGSNCTVTATLVYPTSFNSGYAWLGWSNSSSERTTFLSTSKSYTFAVNSDTGIWAHAVEGKRWMMQVFLKDTGESSYSGISRYKWNTVFSRNPTCGGETMYYQGSWGYVTVMFFPDSSGKKTYTVYLNSGYSVAGWSNTTTPQYGSGQTSYTAANQINVFIKAV